MHYPSPQPPTPSPFSPHAPLPPQLPIAVVSAAAGGDSAAVVVEFSQACRRWARCGGGWRCLRSAVLGLLILALAEAQIVRVSQRLTVIYLLDQSLSIPAAQREAMIEYVNAAVAQASEAGRPGGRDRLRA